MKLLLKILILYFLVGCGAESDLLRDDTSTVPKSLVYEAFKDAAYSYYSREDEKIGFDRLSVDSSCSTVGCTLFQSSFELFDGNISLEDSTKFILTDSGWYEKFSYDECSFSFIGDSSYRVVCPDGRDETHTVLKSSLSQIKLGEYDSDTIEESMLRDTNAKFGINAYKYEISSILLYYELEGKCFSGSAEATNEDLKSYSTLTCQMNNEEILLNDLNESNSTLSDGTAWMHSMLYDSYDAILIEDKSLFISFYDGVVRVGNIIKNPSKKYLNKNAFDTIYTQLSSKYTDESKAYLDLKDEMYELKFFGLDEGYKKFVSSSKDSVNFSKGTFFSTTPSSNWILSSSGLKRAQDNCNIDIYFEKFFYECEDNQKGSFNRLEEKSLSETLMFHYLRDNNISFSLDNNDSFFSNDAKELRYEQKSDNEIYVFNIENSFLVGASPSISNASELNATLFITNLEKDAYMKLENNGSVMIYETNSSNDINTSNSTLVSNSSWQSTEVFDKNLTKIILNSDMKNHFNTATEIYLMEFELSSTRVVSGYKEPQTSTKSFLNFDAYKDIQSNIN
ncbi:MAG: Unknown protein [uncultured Campylobacterales bacterium]|uniref:Uncharacterized protein n=1 Tax=uncultured Campylobacterales bacterium TaxID=352960 RepID=A0A6S6S8J7_9BACT|nr:MAG: Unknown protein [uncultured Campylobacterales bacterium]